MSQWELIYPRGAYGLLEEGIYALLAKSVGRGVNFLTPGLISCSVVKMNAISMSLGEELMCDDRMSV